MPTGIKPLLSVQNRLPKLLGAYADRVRFYREVLDRRIAEAVKAKRSELRVPRPSGLRLRLPGKPFHATPELFFQETGRTRFVLPDQTLISRPGDSMLIPTGMPHGEVWTGRDFLNIIVMFPEEGFSLHLGYLEKSMKCGPIDRFPSNERDVLIRYAEEMAETSDDASGRLIRRGLYLAMLVRMREGLEAPSDFANDSPSLLCRAQELIDSHFAKMDFSVIWLARQLNCSPDHLSRCFRRQYGQRLISYLHRKRTDYARRLLRESVMNVAEVAWACGFALPSYFNKIFRAYSGVSPREFRGRSKFRSSPINET